MQRINGIKLKIGESESSLIGKVAKQQRVKPENIKYFKIVKKSLDARDRNNIFYTYNVDFSLIEEKMTEITSLFKEYGVLLSCHHDGFEKDFLEFIGQADNVEDFNYLKEAKLKNLHKYIVDNKVELAINEDNKNCILVGFMNE